MIDSSSHNQQKLTNLSQANKRCQNRRRTQMKTLKNNKPHNELTNKILKPALSICIGYYLIFYTCAFFKNSLTSSSILPTFEIITISFEIILEILFIYLSYLAIRDMNKKYKKSFYFLTVSYVFLLLTGILYVLIYDYYQIKPSGNPEGSLCFVTFSIYLIFQIVFWLSLLKKKVINKAKSRTFVALGLLGLTSLVILLADSNSYTRFNSSPHYEDIYNIFTGTLNIALFYVSAIALICTTKKAIYWLALSSTMLVGSNLWADYLLQTKLIVSTFDYSDVFWCLGLIIGNFGLIRLRMDNKNRISAWFYSLQKIKCQVSMITFIFTMTTLIILVLLAAYTGIIEKESIISLPFIMISYSVIVLLISDQLGTKLENIFIKLRNNTMYYMENLGNKQKIEADFKTEEFTSLQEFIFKMIDTHNTKTKEKKALSDLARQVAHDIRSPVSAVLMFSKDYVGLPEAQRILLRNSANRIQNIANNLLNYYHDKNDEKLNAGVVSISETVSSVFAEKQYEYQSLPITFSCDIEERSAFSFIKICKVSFERMLSNIINNSVEAISSSGEIKLSVSQKNNYLIILVTDNGCGIPKENIEKILTGAPLSFKKTGHGLGLTYARNLLKKYNADFDIKSSVNEGTTIELKFPITPCPAWIKKSISLQSDSIIIVLDDDLSIHQVWGNRFSGFLAQHPKMQLHHYTNAELCLEEIKKHSTNDSYKRIVLLSDYELINQGINGLDVIEISCINNAVLVTSHFDNISIIKRCMLLNKKILPKTLSPDIDIYVTEKTGELESHEADLVLIENSEELSDILAYLYLNKNKKLIAYSNPYDFLDELPKIRRGTKICFDYDLSLPINGVELASIAQSEGFSNLYLATGYKIDPETLPKSITLLKNKMDLLKL